MELTILTNQAEEVLKEIHEIYKSRIEKGDSISSASFFRYNAYQESEKLSKIAPNDLDTILTELNKAGYIKKYTDGGFYLNPSGVAYREKAFLRFFLALKDIAQFFNFFKK